MSPRAAALAATLALWLAGTAARADEEIVKGAVVKIELREIYVNLGAGQGVAGGTPIRMKRPIKLQHPVTRAVIEDWLPVGSATITQAGAVLSRAVVSGDLVTAIRVGDIAEVLVARPDTRPAGPPVPAPTPPPVPAAPPIDPATREVLDLFAAQSGQPLDARIAAWEHYLSTHPDSPYAAPIRADLEALEALREQLGTAADAQATGQRAIEGVEHVSPRRSPSGAPVPVVFVLDRPERVASAYLHYRTRDRRTYRRELLAREHDIYLRGRVPAEAVRAPGVEYFVEVSMPSGETGLALGTPESPVVVEVEPASLIDRFGGSAEAGRTTVRVDGDYLSFGSLDRRQGDRTDWMTRASVDVSYEIGAVVQRVGIGMAAYAGRGGTLASWSSDFPPPKSGLNLGRADVELGTARLAVGLAWIAGVGREGFGMGAEGRVRIGERRATNLEARVQGLPELGWLADVRLGARPARDLLLGLSVGGTDQPLGGQTAAKLVTELEWIGLPRLALRLRGSWQGRSAAHGGLGVGAGAEVTW
jgi:hypothetical protein